MRLIWSAQISTLTDAIYPELCAALMSALPGFEVLVEASSESESTYRVKWVAVTDSDYKFSVRLLHDSERLTVEVGRRLTMVVGADFERGYYYARESSTTEIAWPSVSERFQLCDPGMLESVVTYIVDKLDWLRKQ